MEAQGALFEDAAFFFQKQGKLIAISKGIEGAVLQSYLSEIPVHTFHVCCASFLAYDGPMELPCRYGSEELVEAQTDWVRLVQCGELQDHLDIAIRGSGAGRRAVRQIILKSCKKGVRAIHTTEEIRWRSNGANSTRSSKAFARPMAFCFKILRVCSKEIRVSFPAGVAAGRL